MEKVKERKSYRKIFTEIRIPICTDLIDMKGKIIDLFWPKMFPHWSIENGVILKFRNHSTAQKATEIMVIEPKRFIYSIENPPTDYYFPERVIKFFNIIEQELHFQDIIRLGIRSEMCIEGIKFDNFIQKTTQDKIFQKKLFSSISKDYVLKDIGITLETTDCRINFGPMNKDEGSPYLNDFINVSDFTDALRDDFIFIDIDVFANNIKYDKKIFKKYFQKKLSMQDEYIKNLTSFLFEDDKIEGH